MPQRQFLEHSCDAVAERRSSVGGGVITSDDERALLARWQKDAQEEASGRDEIDDVLRGMGLNHKERQALRHRGTRRGGRNGQPRPGRGRADRVPHQDRIVKRFAWYIEQRVSDWSGLGITPADAAASWAKLTNYKLEVAQRWWDAGINPAALDQIVELMTHGLQPADLARRVQRHTIAQHLARGSSVQWCLMAAGWTKPTATSVHQPAHDHSSQRNQDHGHVQ